MMTLTEQRAAAEHAAEAFLNPTSQRIRTFDPIAKARANPRSLRLAINGKCWDCIGAGADPNPRAAIHDCRITDCSLWNVRPYQTLGGDGQEAVGIGENGALDADPCLDPSPARFGAGNGLPDHPQS